MVSWIVTIFAISFLVSGGYSFPGLLEHQELEIGLPESVGHEEVFDHHIGISQELHEPKHATSYQSFHLESKNPIPVLVKKEFESPLSHFSEIASHETFTHHIPEVKSLDFHGI